MCSMLLKNWIESRRGVGMQLAAFLKVPPSFVSNIASGKKRIPIVHMAAIESYTAGAVTRKEMCPDGWQKIWPELAEPSNQPVSQQIQAQEATEIIAPAVIEGV